jgi:Trk-type K+ transport system membrane component
MSSHDQNPAFSTHVKMLVLCLGLAVGLAASIAGGFRTAYELVMTIGSR